MKLLMVLSSLQLCFATFTDWTHCDHADEGLCRQGVDSIDICASGNWQSQPQGNYVCEHKQVKPILSANVESTVLLASSTSSHLSDSAPSLHPTEVNKHAVSSEISKVGYFVCTNTKLNPRVGDEESGWASYQPGGKMASVYDAPPEGPFRCDITPAPENYVAFWTQYDPTLTSQPRPLNCGATIRLRNPKNNVSANAQVIDRCASCVGVGRQTADPTTPDLYVNGATVDLSRNLWNTLYDHAPNTTFDIEYDGDVYAGWSSMPEPLKTPRCA